MFMKIRRINDKAEQLFRIYIIYFLFIEGDDGFVRICNMKLLSLDKIRKGIVS